MITLLDHKFKKDVTSLLLVTDFDGVWTDNTVMTNSEGHESITSSKSDSLALSYFRKAMLKLGNKFDLLVITSEQNKVVYLRNQKLGIETFVEDSGKLKIFKRLIDKYRADWDRAFETVYIGNDINDLPCMNFADVSCCPLDSENRVKKIATKILKRKGGDGCIREFIEWYAKIKQINFWEP